MFAVKKEIFIYIWIDKTATTKSFACAYSLPKNFSCFYNESRKI